MKRIHLFISVGIIFFIYFLSTSTVVRKETIIEEQSQKRKFTGRTTENTIPSSETIPPSPYCNAVRTSAAQEVITAKTYASAINKFIESKGDKNQNPLTLFFVAAYCSRNPELFDLTFTDQEDIAKIPPNICQNLAKEVKEDPLSILLSSVDTGSADIKLVLAKNYLIKYKLESIEKGNDSPQMLKIRQNSEHYGQEAVRLGQASAYEFMAQEYESGTFGKIDLVRSYLHMKALADADASSPYQKSVDYLYKKMNRSDLQTAEQLLANCHTADQKISVVNPFQR